MTTSLDQGSGKHEGRLAIAGQPSACWNTRPYSIMIRSTTLLVPVVRIA